MARFRTVISLVIVLPVFFTGLIGFSADVHRTQVDYGFSGSSNLSVSAPMGNFLSYRVAVAAEQFRDELASEIFGSTLPEQAEHVSISVQFRNQEEQARAILRPLNASYGHLVFIIVPHDEERIWPLLKHEMAHCILNARFPDGMPVWASEGICSRYDGTEDKRARQAALNRIFMSSEVPSLSRLMLLESLPADAVNDYALAESITAYLLKHGGMGRFLDFVEAGRSQDWDAALQHFYGDEIGIANVADLERKWAGTVRSK